MAKKLNEALAGALQEVQMVEWRIKALYFACGTFSPTRTNIPTDISCQLYRSLNDAYRHVMLFAQMLDTPEAKKAQKDAVTYYLSEGMSIMEHLDKRGCWDEKDEVDFQTEIADWAEAIGLPRKLFVKEKEAETKQEGDAELRQQVMGSCVPKNEAARWAKRHIEELERRVARAQLQLQVRLNDGSGVDSETIMGNVEEILMGRLPPGRPSLNHASCEDERG